MAKVWFVRSQNRLVALGGRPAYEGDLEKLIWPLDIGLHRYHTAGPLDEEAGPPPTEFAQHDLVMLEVTPADLTAGTNYRVGFYSSPYSPKAAIARLGEAYR
ncbi:MAG: hypothetical protein FJ147_14345 [Deltaproteobacteria bacterium]|nr:hypothetical protein [Deltaproteobacteria bacterium]